MEEIRDYGAPGGRGARPGSVIHRRADGIALHQPRVHHALDIGDQAPRRNQRRMYAQLDPLGGPLGDAEQLDTVAQLLRVADILLGQPRDTFLVALVELHRHAEGDRRHDGELVRGVDSFDVEARVGLRVAELLRFLEHRVERKALLAHLREDEVGGAVDDPGDPLDAVGGEPLAQRLDDGDAARDRAFAGYHRVLFLRGGEDLVAVRGEQRLVRGDHVLAALDRREPRPGAAALRADAEQSHLDRFRLSFFMKWNEVTAIPSRK